MKSEHMKIFLKAGAAQLKITPETSQFLFGYPHVKRYSTGVHDDLWSSALFLDNGSEQVLFIANDIIFVGRKVASEARKAISSETGIDPGKIMITATHTHSGPITVNYLSNEGDPVVPKADQSYVSFLKDQIIQAGILAVQNARRAQWGFGVADDTGVGTNRRNLTGPADHQVPVLVVRDVRTRDYIACMLVCSMHPTVLHEDSTLISGDFPGLARLCLQTNLLGESCPVLHHTGPCGNQSPRHITHSNTFEEARRLGSILGRSIEKIIRTLSFQDRMRIASASALLEDLPRKSPLSVQQASARLEKAVDKLESLRKEKAPAQAVRTAECDWFGAEEAVTLAKAASEGRLEKACAASLPAEIQAVSTGGYTFVGWPGEIFIEYALEVKERSANTFIISLANGELQGYIVTKQAAEEGGYEASNALFSHEAGNLFVEKTLQLLEKLR